MSALLAKLVEIVYGIVDRKRAQRARLRQHAAQARGITSASS